MNARIAELEFGVLVFVEGEKLENPRKTLGAGRRTSNNKLNSRMTLGPGIELDTHWWKASALTTAPSLLQILANRLIGL